MKLLLCLWLSFLSIIPLTKPLPSSEAVHNSFLDRVEDEYQYFTQEWTFDDQKNDISILVVKGIYHDTPSYGISFTSDNFNIVLKTLDGYFNISDPKFFSELNIAIPAEVTYEILIYSEKGNEYQMPEKVLLKKFSADDIDLTTYNLGNNNYKEFIKLQPYTFKLPFYVTLLIVFGSVIGISLIGILILFITKKGFFDKNKRKEGVLDIKSILESDTEDTASDDIFKDFEEAKNSAQSFEKINEEDIESDKINEEIKDIKAYLQSLGYVTDYHILSEDEKNKIMLELMRLRDNKEISLNKYYEETIQLWKK